MTVQLNRNLAVSVLNITSDDSTGCLAVDSWLGANITSVRNVSSSGFLLDSTQLWYDIPVDPDDKVAFLVSWGGTQQEVAGSLYLKINAGDYWRSDLGDYDFLITESTAVSGGSTESQLKRWIVGPLESARFVRAAASSNAGATVGDPAIRFEMSTSTGTRGSLSTGAYTTQERHKIHIQPFKFPTVTYST